MDSPILKDSEKLIKGIYEGDIDAITLKAKPIMSPIMEINTSYQHLELIINKSLLEYEKYKTDLEEMEKINPKYSETILMSKIRNMMICVKNIIHSQDIQKSSMEIAIKKMMNISESDYIPLTEENVQIFREIEKLRNRRNEEKSKKSVEEAKEIIKELENGILEDASKPNGDKNSIPPIIINDTKVEASIPETTVQNTEKIEKPKRKKYYSELVQREIETDELAQ